MKCYEFYVYITTNPAKTVLYTGVTNDIHRRIYKHHENKGTKRSFAGKFFCYNLVWYEYFDDISEAILREKQIKGWTRQKKEALINKTNHRWNTIVPE